jgi:ribulose 1,5-bisphosphate synthetase/thiazole synthase
MSERTGRKMDYLAEPRREIPIIADVDVLVCGGGVAGVAAAVSAARNGAEVMLVERYGFLGGLVTAALVITTPPLDNGINAEICEKLIAKKTYQKCSNPGDDPATSNLTAIDPEIFKHELGTMLIEQEVKLLLHTYIVQSVMEDNVIKGVIIENKAGRQAILADIVIDATGDGDVSAFSKASYETAKTPLPMTMMFNMADVDTGKVLARIGDWGKLRQLIEKAVKNGQLSFDLGLYSAGYAPGLYAANLCYPGEINVWSGSLYDKNGLDPKELTEAEIITREHVMKLASYLINNVEGFEKSRIEYTSTQVGVRETRRIKGGITPSLNEVKTDKFPDTVAKPYIKAEMRVPYRSLVPQGVDNLLVAGRCISAQQDAMTQLRLIPPCLVTGQAVGTAAALALQTNSSPGKLDVTLIQNTLRSQGMDLGL